MEKITRCPTCGTKRIKRVKRNWVGLYQGETYCVPDLEFHECPNCGEKIYGPKAMRKIESYSPAFKKAPALR